jgi:maltooligosyltrehalose trehalohydrolase
MTGDRSHPLGATPLPDGRCRFLVYAPFARTVEVLLLSPPIRAVPLEGDGAGYHRGIVDGVAAGTPYLYRLDGANERPDPASRHQPQGVHGPSLVTDPGAFRWRDRGWRGIPLPDPLFASARVALNTELRRAVSRESLDAAASFRN